MPSGPKIASKRCFLHAVRAAQVVAHEIVETDAERGRSRRRSPPFRFRRQSWIPRDSYARARGRRRYCARSLRGLQAWSAIARALSELPRRSRRRARAARSSRVCAAAGAWRGTRPRPRRAACGHAASATSSFAPRAASHSMMSFEPRLAAPWIARQAHRVRRVDVVAQARDIARRLRATPRALRRTSD